MFFLPTDNVQYINLKRNSDLFAVIHLSTDTHDFSSITLLSININSHSYFSLNVWFLWDLRMQRGVGTWVASWVSWIKTLDWHSSEHSDPKTTAHSYQCTVVLQLLEIAVWWYPTVCFVCFLLNLCMFFCVCICRRPVSWTVCCVRRLCSATCGHWGEIWLTATGTHLTPSSGSSLRATVMQRYTLYTVH